MEEKPIQAASHAGYTGFEHSIERRFIPTDGVEVGKDVVAVDAVAVDEVAVDGVEVDEVAVDGVAVDGVGVDGVEVGKDVVAVDGEEVGKDVVDVVVLVGEAVVFEALSLVFPK